MLICLLLGAGLGQRFKVLVLIPAMALLLPLSAVAAVVRGDSIGQAAAAVLIAAISLQVGYLAGIGLRHLGAARASRPQANSLRTSAPRAAR